MEQCLLLEAWGMLTAIPMLIPQYLQIVQFDIETDTGRRMLFHSIHSKKQLFE